MCCVLDTVSNSTRVKFDMCTCTHVKFDMLKYYFSVLRLPFLKKGEDVTVTSIHSLLLVFPLLSLLRDGWSGTCCKIVYVMHCIIILVGGAFVVAIKVSCVWIYLCNSVRVLVYCLSWLGTPHDKLAQSTGSARSAETGTWSIDSTDCV